MEQKFLFGPGTARKLAALGATLEGNVSFRDQYYDVPDFRLTLADHWLRQREGSGWELKCPPQPLEGASIPSWATNSATEKPPCTPRAPVADHVDPGPPLQPLEGTNVTEPATQYLEVTCPREIVARICELLGVDPDPTWGGNVAAATKGLGLQEFASFVTQRHRYCLGDLNVDLDEADFGYAVGEVEAMVGRQEEISKALERIQTLGCQLGEKAIRSGVSERWFWAATFSPSPHPQQWWDDDLDQ